MGGGQDSMMHKIKEKLFHGEKHTDADWDANYAKFRQLSDSMHKLKAGAHNYAASIYSVFLNSNNTAVEFGALLEDQAVPNEYQSLVRELRSAHAQLASDKQQALTTKLQEQVLQPIDTHIQSLNQINSKVARRNELHENLEYYITKVAALNKERDERSAKGKAESSANIDKHDRNIVKLDAARSDYTNFVTSLMAELNTAWNSRVQVLGPAMAAFVEVEKGFVELYGSGLSMVHKSNQLQSAPEGIALPPVQPSEVPVPAIAQSLGPLPVSSHAGTASTEAASSVHYADQQHLQQQAPIYAASSTSTPQPPVATSSVSEHNPFAEAPVQQHLQQQQSQPSPPQQAPIHTLPHDQAVSAGAPLSSAAPLPLDNQSQNPFEQPSTTTTTVSMPVPVAHEAAAGAGVVAVQPQQSATISALSPKSQWEEESKRQRFAEEQKQQQHQEMA